VCVCVCEKSCRTFDFAQVRLAGRQNKISTQMSVLADVVRESSYWAKTQGKSIVTVTHL
jgi:predicted ATP-dependent protease